MYMECRDGAVVRMLTSHQCTPHSILAQCHMWVEFVVGSHLAPRYFSGLSSFPPSTKKPTSPWPIPIPPGYSTSMKIS